MKQVLAKTIPFYKKSQINYVVVPYFDEFNVNEIAKLHVNNANLANRIPELKAYKEKLDSHLNLE